MFLFRGQVPGCAAFKHRGEPGCHEDDQETPGQRDGHQDCVPPFPRLVEDREKDLPEPQPEGHDGDDQHEGADAEHLAVHRASVSRCVSAVKEQVKEQQSAQDTHGQTDREDTDHRPHEAQQRTADQTE